MASIENKVDFAAVIAVDNANPNGDPLNGNRPRTNIDGLGELSDVCIKRKIRNRLQDLGERVFVQANDRADDGCKSLWDRASKVIAENRDEDALVAAACREWIDVRMFGQLMAFKGKGDATKISVGIRGPVSIRPAFSVSPVNITSVQITKSVNSEGAEKRSSDTMGMKHRVDHGVYVLFGSINPQLAKRTGFSDADAELLKKALITLFENDSSSARPDGSMDVVRVYWWKHSCPSGQYPSAKVHGSLKVVPKREDACRIEDYDIELSRLDGLEPEIYRSGGGAAPSLATS